MISLEELQNMWDSDAKVNPLDLGKSAQDNSSLGAKYGRHLANFRLASRRANVALVDKKRIRWRYFRGDLSQSELKELGWDQYRLATPLKAEMEMLVESAPEIVTATDRVEYIETVVLYLEGVLKTLSNRTWDIKTALEYEKYTHGF